jgi:hypothetical protein
MGDELFSGDFRDEWQNQNREAFRMSADEIRQRIEQVNVKVYGRNRVIHFLALIGTCLVLLTGIAVLMGNHDPLVRIGWALLLGSFAFDFYRGASYRRTEKIAAQRAAETGNQASVDFFKGQLERLRDFHSGKRYWPGVLLNVAGITLVAHESRILVIATILVASVTAPLIFRTTRQYQHQLDEINRLQDPLWGR